MKNIISNKIKSLIFTLLVGLGLLIPANVVGQGKSEATPLPVGGIKAIAQNLIYPAEAKAENIQGKVVAKVLVDEEGNVVETTLLKGIGHGCDEAALKAIKITKFIPAKKDGKNIKAEVTIPIMFKLNNNDKDVKLKK